ncbi:HNH endonuclease signature motif containing protein [Novosphingobium mathurense]|uniref:HNH endonuclease n=1 Tax=Novosphingobium mathurense TaxID=428990 RepID=A0A1U6HK33_9SPHN|nr:HNH endonuclease signature motif containing protein [Novosphingobium mathurense]SLJ96113.1 HNH endonuclease [Novosphingobium mathurense]
MRFFALEAPLPGLAKPCQVCVSHKPNADGYLYKTWKVGDRKVKEAFHRFIFRAHNGWNEWPKGLEIDHKCGQRLCCEPTHLRALQVSDHKRVTNTLRYAARHEAAHCHWLATGCTGTALAEKFGVTVSSGCRWIREWRDNPDAA